MENASSFRASFRSISPNCYCASRSVPRSGVSSRFLLSYVWVQKRPPFSHVKFGSKKMEFLSRNRSEIKASMQPSDSGNSATPIAPLQLESPVGQFLSQIMVSHPHLVAAAVEQQLDQLQTDQDTDRKEFPSASGTELLLYRRIAEVKAKERRKALAEILYALVVQKFMDANVPLIPAIAPSPNNFGCVDAWPSEDDKLERLHSPEAYEMIHNHLTLVLGSRLNDSTAGPEISKLKVGQLYAASVMYGYFLKRVDQRFQLEKGMKAIHDGIDYKENDEQQITAVERTSSSGSSEPSSNPPPHPEASSWSEGTDNGDFIGIKPSGLRTYVMSCDVETLHRYALIRSKEAISIIEKHTEALLGKPEIVITPEGTGGSGKKESIKISFVGLKRLVLEAVTFGSFLWDVESYVDTKYHFVSK